MWMLTPFGSLWTLGALWALSWFLLAILCIRIERSQAATMRLPTVRTNLSYGTSKPYQGCKEPSKGWETSLVRRVLRKIFLLPDTEEQDERGMETQRMADDALSKLEQSTNRLCDRLEQSDLKKVQKG